MKQSELLQECEELPIKYVDEAINADRLRGRMMGLMAEISKRTDNPITFDDEILKEDNILLHAFLRVVKVVTKEEQRVMNALMDEAKKMSETETGKESENGTIRALEFVIGWKSEANKIFEDGGSMYDLLTFSIPEYTKRIDDVKNVKGYRGKLQDGILEKFEENGKYGLKDKQGNVIVSADYDAIVGSGWMGRGWHLRQEGKWGAVNERGEWMFPVEYDDIKTRYEGGHYLTKNGKKGYCNSEGVVTIDFLYDDLDNYSDSWDGFKAKLDGRWGYVDGNGKVVVPIDYDSIDLESNGMIRVERNNKYGFYNSKTKVYTAEKYDRAWGYTSSHPEESVVKIGDKWGVVNAQDEIILPLEYDDMNIDSENVYRVKQNGLCGIIDKDGQIVFPFKYQNLGKFDENGITYAKNDAGLYGYIDKNDNVLIQFAYRYASNFDGRYAEVGMGLNEKGVIDNTGKVVIPMKYHDVHIGWDDVVEVRVDDRMNHRWLRGLYDLKTGNILPCIYERISPRGRVRDGLLECECWKNSDADPITLKVTSRHQITGIRQKETYYVNLYQLADGQFEIADIRGRKEPNMNMNLCNINISGRFWIETECVNKVLYLPKTVEGGEIIGLMSFGCWTDGSPIKGLIVPVGYKYIGGEAFMAHQTLEFVSLPNGIRKIEDSAFCHCPNLKHVFLGDTNRILFIRRHPLSIIEGSAFDSCHPSLTFYIPDGYEGMPYDMNKFMRVEPRRQYEDEIISNYLNVNAAIDFKCGRIAIARDFAVVLQDNEWELALLGRNPNFRQLGHNLIKLAAGFDGYMALDKRGCIYAGPRAREFECGYEIEALHDVADVVGCEGHTVALHTDGTVTCIDEPGGYEGPDRFADAVRNWNSIVQVACGFDFVAGLKSDGTLVSVGRYYNCPDWRGIKQFDAFNCYYGRIYTIALLDDGRVVTDYTDEVSEWRNVVRVRMGNNGFAVGLKSDGTAYAIGDDGFVRDVQSWRNIVDIECKFDKAVAILADGSIVSTGF